MHKYKRGITWNNLSLVAQHLKWEYEERSEKCWGKNIEEKVGKMEETKRLDEVESGGV